jgi:hypothetical protein
MPALPQPVLLMAEHAHGIVSVRDLVAAGHDRRTVRRWVDYGLLEQVGRAELRVPGSPRTRLQELRCMLDRAGSGARLAGGLLLGLRGLEGFTHVRDDHVAVPASRRPRGVGFVIVRTRLPVEDWDRFEDLPAVTVTRALIGAAVTSRQARVRAAYDEARRRGLTSTGLLTQRLEALGNVHGAAQMRAIVRSGALRMESEGERRLLGIFRPEDPPPEPQVWVRWSDRYFRLDLAYLDAALDIEYDGGHHANRRHEDADRNLALAELAIQTLGVTSAMLRDPEGTRRRILAVRRQRLAMRVRPIVPSPPPWTGRRIGPLARDPGASDR